MKTNVFTDEEAQNKDPEIGQHLENLIDRISNSLSGTALDFYKREFDFFDKVTSVSGTIRYLIQHKNSTKGKYCSVAFISVVTP